MSSVEASQPDSRIYYIMISAVILCVNVTFAHAEFLFIYYVIMYFLFALHIIYIPTFIAL